MTRTALAAWAVAAAVVTTSVLAVAATGAARPGVPADGARRFGPFGRGCRPIRASIGKGHVLTGVVCPRSTAGRSVVRGSSSGRRTQRGSTFAPSAGRSSPTETAASGSKGRIRRPTRGRRRTSTCASSRPRTRCCCRASSPRPRARRGSITARPRAAGGLGGLGETVLVPRGAAAARGTWRLFRPPSRR